MNNPALAQDSNSVPFVVSRWEIPALNFVEKHGQQHQLGIVKDLRKHSALAKILPDEGRPAISWVRLTAGQTLTPHRHPILSMIIVCKGAVDSLGDVQQRLHEGDIFMIPPQAKHGFRGAGSEGFWGLSIQFEQHGLYENPTNALVEFSDEDKKKSNTPNACSSYHTLVQHQKTLAQDFSHNPLFLLAESDFFSTAQRKERFLSYFQIWSDFFQKTVLARAVFSTTSAFQSIADQHLLEEAGHNTQLKKDFPGTTPPWDAELEALCSWFTWKMLTLDDAARLILMHWVIERSADIFYSRMTDLFKDTQSYAHFILHKKMDASKHNHAQMGAHLIEKLPALEYERLNQIQKQGWTILNQLFARMTCLVTKED